MSEIITLQAGHKSNFIGTHWWNLQESAFCYDVSATNVPEVNPRITFREGITRNGEPTFTPRVVCIDLKGSLKTLPEQGSLYGTSSSEKQNLIWDGQTAVHAEKTQEKNQFLQDLESQDNVCDEDKDICSECLSEITPKFAILCPTTLSAAQSFHDLHKLFGEGKIGQSQVERWLKKLKSGDTNLADEEGGNGPSFP